jgi:site-specific recombinase XerD
MPTLFQKPNSPYWYIHYRKDGKQHRRSTKTTNKKEAEAQLHSIADKINRNEFFTQEEISAPQFAEKYLLYSQNHKSKSTYQRDKTIINYFFKKYPLPLKKFRTTHIEEFINSRIQSGIKHGTINRELGAIGAMFNKAIKWKHLKENPAKDVKKLPDTTKKLPRFLTVDEFNAVLDECSPWLYNIIATLIATGTRIGELINLTWDDINFKQRRIHIQSKDDWHPKTYEIRTIPMHPEVFNILQKLPKDKKYVFTSAEGYKINSRNLQRRHFRRITKKLKFKDVTIHTLRHTFASHLVMKGVDILTVSKLLGHSNTKTTEIYSHIAPEHLQVAVDRVPLPIRVSLPIISI